MKQFKGCKNRMKFLLNTNHHCNLTYVNISLINRPLPTLELHEDVVGQVHEHVGHKHHQQVVGCSRLVTAGFHSKENTEEEVETRGEGKEHEQRPDSHVTFLSFSKQFLDF